MAKMWIKMFNLIFKKMFAVVIIDPQVKKKDGHARFKTVPLNL